MLTKLKIKNFQCHENIKINLGNPVTVLIGNNDKGKSAILRALRWLCLNKPGGSSFITHGKKYTKVILDVDGHRIKRCKGKNNSYHYDGKAFYAFSNKVPEDLSQALNISEVSFGGQHDAVFLFSKSPGQISKELNSVIDLSIIDRSLANIASKVRSSKSVVEVSRSRLQKAKTAKQELSWVKEQDKELKCLEALEKDLLDKRSKASVGSLLLSKANKLRLALESVPEANPAAWKEIVEAKEMANRTNKAYQQAQETLCLVQESQRKLEWASQNLDCQRDAISHFLKKHPNCPVCERPM